jgi:hypothetical protein
MNVEDVLSESMEMDGALGAVAFIVLKALSEAGASQAESEAAEKLLFKHFAALSDEQCNVLAEVAHRRLVARPASGRWY